MKKIFVFLLFVINLLASSFGASGVDSIELTESEKITFKNQKDIKGMKKDITKLKMQLNTVKENIDGMKSILESTNDKISQTSQKKTNLNDADLKKLQDKVNRLEKENNRRFKKIEKSLDKLLKLLSSSKSSHDREDVVKKLKPYKTAKDIKKLSAKDAFKKAESLYAKKKIQRCS